MATVRRMGLGVRIPKRPNREERFLNAAGRDFVENGEWSSKDDLDHRFMQAGAVEFYGSWPRLNPRFARIMNGQVELSVEGLAQVAGAERFLLQYIDTLHIAVEQYQEKDSKPLISAARLVKELPGVSERRAMGLMRMLEREGLLRRASPRAGSGILTAQLTRFTGVGDISQYLWKARGVTRWRRLKQMRTFVRRVLMQVIGPDSSLWGKLAAGVAMAALGLIIGNVGGLSL